MIVTIDLGEEEVVRRPASLASPARRRDEVVQQENIRLRAVTLGFLTEAQREVFILHYDQGLAYEEIAQIVGIRPGAARALAHRAKAALRDKLGSEVWISRHAS